MDEKTKPLSSDDKVMAVISHLLGLFVAVIVWVVNKDKSDYVKYHAVQAIGFGLVMMILSTLFSFAAMLVVFSFVFGEMLTVGMESDPGMMPFLMFPAVFPLGIFVIVLPLTLVNWGFRIYAIVRVLQERDFQYPLIGGWVRRNLYDN